MKTCEYCHFLHEKLQISDWKTTDTPKARGRVVVVVKKHAAMHAAMSAAMRAAMHA